MDALELLTDDHRRIGHLMERLLDITSASACFQILAELQREMDLHGRVERDVFYPALRGHSIDAEVESADRDIEAIHTALAEVNATAFGSPDWQVSLRRLKQAIESQFQDEERNLFPRARRSISRAERRSMADAMKNERDRLIGIRGSVDDLMPRDHHAP